MAALPPRPSSAPTLLLGVGAVGERLTRFLGERLANTFLAQAGMLVVLDAREPAMVAKGIERLTRQRTALLAEQGLDLRAPFDRYLRLQLIAVGNIEEMAALSPNPMFDVAERFLAYPHPPEGLRLGFVLDASASESVGAVASGVRPILESLETLAHMASRKGPAPTATVVLAHRKLLDGTHLDHANLEDASAIEPDEFERVVSRLLEAMARPGEEGVWETDAARRIRYLFVGGGSTVFPRELLLGATSKLLGADLLERTREPETSPLPPNTLAESRDELLKTALQALKSPSVTLVPRVREAAKPSLFARLFDDKPEVGAAQGIGLRTAADLGDLNRASAQELSESYESAGDAIRTRFEAALVRALNEVGPGLAASVAAGIRRDVDAMIGDELGGVDRARRSIEATQAAILASLTPEEQSRLKAAGAGVPTGDPTGSLAPPYLEPSSKEFPDDTASLLARFRKAVRRLPALPAVLARGLLVGAVLGPVLGAASMPAYWLASTGSLLLFGGLYWRQRKRVEGMRRELLLRLEDSLGRVAYAKTHESLGVGPEGEPGVLPMAWHYLEEWEKPLVRGFDELREGGIHLMRRIDEWPDGFLPGVDWLDERDPFLLHGDRRYEPSALTETAARLLGEDRMFLDWRHPSMPAMEAILKPTAREGRLTSFELEAMRVGEFVRHLDGLLDPHEPEAANAARVVGRLDALAFRCVPLAQNVDERAPEQAEMRTLRLAVPESLDWSGCAARHTGSHAVPSIAIPSTAGFTHRAAWLFPDEHVEVVTDEADHATALALFPARDADEAVRWLGGTGSDAHQGAKRALLVGVAAYAEGRLEAPVRNTEELAASLREIGFTVETLLDADLSTTQAAVERFATGLDESSIALFAFNGHGCEVGGENLLSTVEGGAYPLSDLFANLEDVPATKVVVLDCCRSAREGAGVLRRVTAPPNTIVAYATGEICVAYDDFYTPELARTLHKPNLRLEDVFIQTREAVVKRSRGRQVPWEEASLGRVVVLNPR